jgi:hypothetical protein
MRSYITFLSAGFQKQKQKRRRFSSFGTLRTEAARFAHRDRLSVPAPAHIVQRWQTAFYILHSGEA